MTDDTSTSWAEDRRLDLVVHKALEDASTRWQTISGRDRLALQMEWIEFLTDDWSDWMSNGWTSSGMGTMSQSHFMSQGKSSRKTKQGLC